MNNRGQTTIISAYDNLGNLTEKKKADNSESTTFTWDQRNRLVGIAKTGSTPTTATFGYDEFGRRIERTVNGETTRYVYEGDQAILEIRNTETASILTGIGIDEVIARYVNGNNAATRTYLGNL